LVANDPTLAGIASLLVRDNELYVTGSVGAAPTFQGRVAKFNATTGALDTPWGTGGYINTPVAFPAGLTATADGTGFLVSMLTLAPGGVGRVDRYLWDGTSQGTWANASSVNTSRNFREATAMLTVVPEPATLASGALLAVGLVTRRRRARRGH
jgi:hypothetical protein